VLAARLLGSRLSERIGGVDLIEHFVVAAPRGTRLFLLGAGPGVAEQAAAVLGNRNPGLILAGTYAGSPRPEHQDEIVKKINAARPHVLLVAFGAPTQELWIARNRDHLLAPLCIGVGGAFDYISGRTPRAPLIVQRAGLEWLYRLARQPWRWRRMLALPRFAALVLVECLRVRVFVPRRKPREGSSL
jgi:N-acetylglucosaminyldiphosphoundecaprenol N-acetyl-beta-D-mannosaminyltransferase